MAEYGIAFVTFLMVSLVMIGLGISQYRSKEPVGFYTGQEPPGREQLSDTKAWNHRHGILWMAYGIAIFAAYIISACIGSDFALIILGGVVVGALPLMMWYHHHLKKKYFIK